MPGRLLTSMVFSGLMLSSTTVFAFGSAGTIDLTDSLSASKTAPSESAKLPSSSRRLALKAPAEHTHLTMVDNGFPAYAFVNLEDFKKTDCKAHCIIVQFGRTTRRVLQMAYKDDVGHRRYVTDLGPISGTYKQVITVCQNLGEEYKSISSLLSPMGHRNLDPGHLASNLDPMVSVPVTEFGFDDSHETMKPITKITPGITCRK